MTGQAIDSHRLQHQLLRIGLAALGICLLVGLFNSAAFFRAYLLACLFWLSLSLGSLALLAIHEVSGGAWGQLIRRVLKAAIAPLPVMALLFIPLLFGLAILFSWVHASEDAPEALQAKLGYLNSSFLVVRTLGYFAIWIALAMALRVWRDDSAERRPGTGAIGVMLYTLTISFFAIDWIMSLAPLWYSTAIGFLVAGSQLCGALAFAILMARLWPGEQGAGATDPVSQFQDLGNLLLAGVMFWTYIAYMQYLIIWSGDLPEEIVWYVQRSQDGWGAIAWTLVLCHFVLPFALLISRQVKRTWSLLAGVAGLVLLARLVDVYWLIGPAAYAEGGHMYRAGLELAARLFNAHWLIEPGPMPWLDAAALLGVGGVWLAVFLRRVQRQTAPSPELTSRRTPA